MTLSMTKTPEQNQKGKKLNQSASFAEARPVIISISTGIMNRLAAVIASEGRKSVEQTGLSAEKLRTEPGAAGNRKADRRALQQKKTDPCGDGCAAGSDGGRCQKWKIG